MKMTKYPLVQHSCYRAPQLYVLLMFVLSYQISDVLNIALLASVLMRGLSQASQWLFCLICRLNELSSPDTANGYCNGHRPLCSSGVERKMTRALCVSIVERLPRGIIYNLF